MSTTSLLNLPMTIIVSDPWEFGTECGTGPFIRIGTVTDTTSDTLLIRLLKPIDYCGKKLQTVVARPRHVGDVLQMVAIKAMPMNLMLLPLDIRMASELRPSVKKDGIVAIGTVALRKP